MKLIGCCILLFTAGAAIARADEIEHGSTVEDFVSSCEIGDGKCEAFVMSVFNAMLKESALVRACPTSQRIPRSEIPRYLANAAMIEGKRATGSLRYYNAKLMIAQVVATCFPCPGDD